MLSSGCGYRDVQSAAAGCGLVTIDVRVATIAGIANYEIVTQHLECRGCYNDSYASMYINAGCGTDSDSHMCSDIWMILLSFYF